MASASLAVFVPGSDSLRGCLNLRNDGSSVLIEHLSKSRHTPFDRQILVGHSHGGTVIADALLAQPAYASILGIGGVATIATPYLSLTRSTEAAGFASWCVPAGVLSFFLLLNAALWLSGNGIWTSWLLALGTLSLLGTVGRYAAAAARPVLRALYHLVFGTIGIAAVGFSTAVAWTLVPADWTFRAAVPAVGGLALMLATLLTAWSTHVAGTLPFNDGTAVLIDVCRAFRGIALCALMVGGISWSILSSSPWAFALPLAWCALTLALACSESFAAMVRSRFQLLGTALVNDEGPVPHLPCPWLALRLPGDEASLAIAAGQIARTWFDLPLAGLRLLKRLVENCSARATYTIAAALFLLDAVASFALAHVRGEGIVSGVIYALGLPVAAGGWLFVLAVPFGALVFLALGTITSALQALAAGSDLFSVTTAVHLDAEPLPRCSNPEMCRLLLLWPDKAHQPSGLRHSAYETPEVPLRIAVWIAGLLAH